MLSLFGFSSVAMLCSERTVVVTRSWDVIEQRHCMTEVLIQKSHRLSCPLATSAPGTALAILVGACPVLGAAHVVIIHPLHYSTSCKPALVMRTMRHFSPCRSQNSRFSLHDLSVPAWTGISPLAPCTSSGCLGVANRMNAIPITLLAARLPVLRQQQ